MRASPRQRSQPSLRNTGNFTSSGLSRVDTRELETANDFVQSVSENEADDAILAAASSTFPPRLASTSGPSSPRHHAVTQDHPSPVRV